MDRINEQFLATFNLPADALFKTVYQTLMDAYHRATEQDIADGMDWYDKARRLAKACAEQTGLDWRTVVGIIAVLSPKNQWYGPYGQEKTTLPLIRHFQKGGDVKSAPGLATGPNKAKAREMVRQNKVFPYLKGPKVGAFYRAICGEEDTTLDIWAIRAAFNLPLLSENTREVDKVEQSAKVRPIVVAAYKAATATAGLREEQFQAIVWLVVKREMSDAIRERVQRIKALKKAARAACKAAKAA